MFLTLFIGCYLELVSGFRGPHHPRSSLSHHHYVPQKDIKLTEDAQIFHDTAHLMEDMESLGDHIDLSKMSGQELEFYYFKAHDSDNNTKLDGLEMLHAIQHTFHENEVNDHGDMDNEENISSQTSLIVELIDHVLEEDDLDNDGYLSYMEYAVARQKADKNTDQVESKSKKFQI